MKPVGLKSRTVANHVTNDVCFIPIMRAAIMKFLPARRRFSRRFHDTEEHLGKSHLFLGGGPITISCVRQTF